MQFNLPTTQTEMYTLLNELFHFYRITRAGYSGTTLEAIQLNRMSYEKPTDTQIYSIAQTLVDAEHKREIKEKKSKIESDIIQYTKKISALESDTVKAIENVKALYKESVEKVEAQAVKNGLIYTDSVMSKISELEEKKNEKILALNASKNEKTSDYNSIIIGFQSQLNALESAYSEIHEADVQKKVEELKEQYAKTEREVFKYNNALDEKEKRNQNSIAQANAMLELEFLKISAGEFTKDQLVEMGYYEDVVKCVCGYYDRLDGLTAFQQISSDKKVPIYLDDYYQNIVYMYKSKSGL